MDEHLLETDGPTPERAEVMERMLAEVGPVLSPRARQVITQDVTRARGGVSTATCVLNADNRVVQRIVEFCAGENTLQTSTESSPGNRFGDVLHEIYHVARAYSEPTTVESKHFFDHRNSLLLSLMEDAEKLANTKSERDQLQVVVGTHKSNTARGYIEARQQHCVMLLTDLAGSTRMVGFLDSQDSAQILQGWTRQVQNLVEDLDGTVEKFTGDGVFAYFEIHENSAADAAQKAADCAFKLLGITQKYFQAKGEVADRLQKAGGIHIHGCRTVLHVADVMYGEFAGAPALVGRQVVALFRACDRDTLFKKCPIILSEPFLNLLGLPLSAVPPKVVKNKVKLDNALPPMSFYGHPSLNKLGSE